MNSQLDEALSSWAEETANTVPDEEAMARWAEQARRNGEARVRFATWRTFLFAAAAVTLLLYGWSNTLVEQLGEAAWFGGAQL